MNSCASLGPVTNGLRTKALLKSLLKIMGETDQSQRAIHDVSISSMRSLPESESGGSVLETPPPEDLLMLPLGVKLGSRSVVVALKI